MGTPVLQLARNWILPTIRMSLEVDFLPRASRQEPSQANTWISTMSHPEQRASHAVPDLQNCEVLNLCCLSCCICGNFLPNYRKLIQGPPLWRSSSDTVRTKFLSLLLSWREESLVLVCSTGAENKEMCVRLLRGQEWHYFTRCYYIWLWLHNCPVNYNHVYGFLS